MLSVIFLGKAFVIRHWPIRSKSAGQSLPSPMQEPGSGRHLLWFRLLSQGTAAQPDSFPYGFGQRLRFTLEAFVDQLIKGIRIRWFIGLQVQPLTATNNRRGMALKSGIGQPAG